MKRKTGLALMAIVVGALVAGVMAGLMSWQRPALDQTTWYLTRWSESTVIPSGSLVSFYIDGVEYVGSTGVNDFTGTIARDGRVMSLSAPNLTTHLTGQWSQDVVEQAYLTLLPQMSGWQIDGDVLTLTGNGHQLIFTQQ
ncbi:MAG: META domain-containing protein [Propionibacteriaceae bacterium]|jgi:heat shock protein HslJ|nr:META domain-containing protein [Propionibacteriaceae bacterium]